MIEEEEEESRSSFLVKNLVKGLLWLFVIVVLFIFAEEFIQNNFEKDIVLLKDRPLILFSIFFGSEVLFGIIPPVFFMTIWKLFLNSSLQEYILNLFILTILSFIAGIIGYFVGKFFSTRALYRKLDARYLHQYNQKLKKYGPFLVLVGALTPVPFSATCMMAGSVSIPFKDFIWVCDARVFYFIIYGWIVWAFPNLFV
jgi:membrane protein DedA with SNARE-associated domain